tara:strand:+ start:1085 stop:1279 length:195 start_codon:yes stop_codon:yes gene_type:complete
MNTYTFITKSYVTHEVTVQAKSEDKAWEIMQSGEGGEVEIDSNTYSEELDWSDEEETEGQDNEA